MLILGSIGQTEKLGDAIIRVGRMYRLGVSMSQELLLHLLQRCTKEKDAVSGQYVHQLMVGVGLDFVAILVEHLIRLFTLSHCLFEADVIFCKVAKPTVFTWHAVILANVEHNNNARALELCIKMQQDGIQPNKFIYMGVLKASSKLGALECGRLLNCEIIRSGLEFDVVLGNTLIDMYAKSGSLVEASKIFDDLPCRDILSWGALLGGYVEHGQGVFAIQLFEKMLHEGTKPNKVILLCMLRACGGSGALHQGKLLHDHVIRHGLEADAVLRSALIDMYAKCGNSPEACNVLDLSKSRCVVSWGALIGGLTQQGQSVSAFDMFKKMQQDGIKPNEFIFSCLVTACGKSRDLRRGKFLHDQVLKAGVESDVVLGNTLVGMYADCECLQMAQNVFDKLPTRTEVSWNTMISGYMHNGHALDALKLFERMQEEASKANMNIYSSILKACSNLGAIELGKLAHHYLLKNEFELDMVVGGTLIEMYALCHCLEEACRVFDSLPHRNTVCWGMIIVSMAQSGNFRMAEQYLEKMLQQGFKLSAKAFTSLLVACNQKGRFEEGQQYFKLMTENHGIMPSVEHIHCMVDLLGRTGHLVKAEKLLQSVPVTSDLSGWISLLSACRMHGSVSLGRQCFNQIVSQDSHIGAAYTLMSCIYGDAHMWDDYYQLMELMKSNVPDVECKLYGREQLQI